jgi:voltage-gated potassium channel
VPRAPEWERDPWQRVRISAGVLGLVTVGGTVAYMILGLSFLDAVYQTVTTISTVGFGEIEPMSTRERLFTMVLILGGVGTAIYILSGLVEAVVDGELGELLGRRRMERRIAHWSGHVIICGYGRVGRSIAALVATRGHRRGGGRPRRRPLGRPARRHPAGRRHR